MPLYTAIRHERPWKDWVDPEYPFGKEYHNTKEHKNAPDAWFQWFEFNPYEIGCDELQCMFKPREHILTMVCEIFPLHQSVKFVFFRLAAKLVVRSSF